MVAILLLIASTVSMATEIRLVYPRLLADQDSFRYAPGLDSSFVFGQVVNHPRASILTCNGHTIALTPDGAFLAYLPLPPASATSAWSLTLTYRGDTLDQVRFPVAWAIDGDSIVWDTLPAGSTFRVQAENAHTRTMPGGSYHLFPAPGSLLEGLAGSARWVKFRLGLMSGVIERGFLEDAPANTLPSPVIVGDAEIRAQAEWSRCDFRVSRIPLFSSELSRDRLSLTLLLYDGVSAVDRIHFLDKARDAISDIVWSQEPNGLRIEIRSQRSLEPGYHVTATDSVLSVFIRRPRSASLRDKTIVIDPGHGGSADGAIGPRGSREKDVVLTWAAVLAAELEKSGATVVLTRERDMSLGLHDRVAMARHVNADAFLSLHANALPDGERPALHRGCGTYYYNSGSRPLAENLQAELLAATGAADDGVFDANFAVVRPTDFPAVLIEAGYLMHPDEELRLLDPAYLRSLSKAVVRALKQYFRESSAR